MKHFTIFTLLFLIFSSPFVNAQEDNKAGTFSIDGYFFFRPDLDFNHGNPDFFIGNKAFNFFLRSDLGVDYFLSKNVRIRTSIQSFGVYTLDDGPLDAQLRVFEAFAEMKDIGGSKLDLKFGRFTLGDYGTGMLIGDQDWYKGRTFDAVKLSYNPGKLKSDLIWLQLYQLSDQLDGWNHPVLFLQHNHYKFSQARLLDAYVYFLVDKHVGPYRSYTLMPGLRFSDKTRALRFYAEINPQTGWLDPGIDNDTIGGGSIFAYGAEAGISYLFSAKKKTEIGLHYYISSGDDDLQDNQLKTYNSFWQEEHQRFGNIDLWLGSNIQAFTLGFRTKLNANFSYGVNLVQAAVLVAGDPSPGLLKANVITTTNPDAGTNIGFGGDIYCKYKYSDELKFIFNYSLFNPGDYILDNGGKDAFIMRLYAMCVARF